MQDNLTTFKNSNTDAHSWRAKALAWRERLDHKRAERMLAMELQKKSIDLRLVHKLQQEAGIEDLSSFKRYPGSRLIYEARLRLHKAQADGWEGTL